MAYQVITATRMENQVYKRIELKQDILPWKPSTFSRPAQRLLTRLKLGHTHLAQLP